MESSIYRFVLRHSARDTLVIILLTVASLPLQYVALDIPKNIINRAIVGRNMEFPAPHPTELDPFGWFVVPLNQYWYLAVLCFFFFLMVILNGALKQFINSLKGKLGERLLRRLRFQLLARMLRFPLPQFKKVSQGELIPMITSEVETLGGYMGDVYAQPLIQAGTLLTIATFLFVQNWIMGLAAISLFPIQAYIIPRLQRRVNQLGKQRVRAVRKLSERIGEGVSGIQEVRGHGTVNYERTDFSERLGLIYRIRYEIFQRKAFVKFLNNFLNQMAPLLFYSIGGYLVIEGQLTIGALTAALAAHKDMSAPWKELLDYYQQTQDAKIKYDQVTEQFRVPDLIDEKVQEPIAAAPEPLAGPLAAANISYAEDPTVRLLDSVTFTIQPGEKVAVVGPPGGGKETLALLLARLELPTGGQITIGGRDLATLPEQATGSRIGYVGQGPYLFSASVRDNLTYGLRQRPVALPSYEGEAGAARRRMIQESARAGNVDLDVDADWVDYAAAGVGDQQSLSSRLIDAIRLTDMEDDIYQFGLRGTIDPKRRPEIASSVLEARQALLTRLQGDAALSALVEPIDPARYNSNATMAENLLFGTPVGAAFDVDKLAENSYVLAVLDKVGLTADLVEVGRQVAETMVEIFADLPPGHEFFEQFSFISSEDLPAFQALLQRAPKAGGEIKPEDRARLLSLPFKLIPARHRLDLLDEALQARILEARAVFRADLPPALADAVEFFDPTAYNASATLQDNVLFGKLVYGQVKAGAQIGRAIAELIDQLGLRRTVIEVGLDFPAGVGGARLSGAQRQKLAIARVLVKRPDLVIVNEATAILDSQVQNRITEGIFRESEGRILIWVLHSAALAKRFDRVLLIAEGRLQEDGRFAELEQSGSALSELLAAS